jgi:hypothetical protein
VSSDITGSFRVVPDRQRTTQGAACIKESMQLRTVKGVQIAGA